MKTIQSKDKRPLHQTVAQAFDYMVGSRAIAIDFTDQQLSAHAGSATF